MAPTRPRVIEIALIALADTDAPAIDFGDPESQRVLAAAADAVAYELGREAAREYFSKLIGKPKAP